MEFLQLKGCFRIGNSVVKGGVFVVLLLLISVYVFCGCEVLRQGSSVGGEYSPPVPDYSELSSWICQCRTPEKPIDVFYVHPTIYGDESPANMDIRDKRLRGVAEKLLDSQAGVYRNEANLFAPFYRQMSMARLNSDENMYENKFFATGYQDVCRAFEYYLRNFNKGRPFILAGHSQGSMVLIRLMRERFNDDHLQEKLVAAYLIGYSVTQDDFRNYPWMKPARGAEDTGVIISFNTQAPDAEGSPVLLPGAFCINPLNWKTDETPADKSMNAGALFFDDVKGGIKREIPAYAGARIDKVSGALVTELPEKLDVGGFPPGVYHRYDYAIWYRNLQENVKIRCQKYMDNYNE